MAQTFLGTPKNQSKYGAMANSGYVDALYTNALNHHVEADGLQFWTTRQDAGSSRADLAVQLTDSTKDMSVHFSQIEQGWHLT